jgi:hypothetical protein
MNRKVFREPARSLAKVTPFASASKQPQGWLLKGLAHPGPQAAFSL